MAELTDIEEVEIIQAGPRYLEAFADIVAQSRETIYFFSYIFLHDEIGARIEDLLKQAAKRGVKVYFLVDVFGSLELSEYSLDRLRAAGVEARIFGHHNNLGRFHVGRRLHIKVLVGDRDKLLIGGINIGKDFLAGDHPWLDYAAYIKSILADQAKSYCEQVFFKDEISEYTTPVREKMADISMARGRILVQDFLKREKGIEDAYKHAIASARDRIYLIHGYFLPDLFFLHRLYKAARQGISIYLVLPSISDVTLFRNATRHLYSKLIRNNIKVYEWKNSVLHAKACVVDGKWLTIGSYNLNYTSSWGNLELNVEIEGRGVAGDFEKHIQESIIAQCEEIKLRRFSMPEKIINRICYILVRILAVFSKLFTNSE